MIFRVVEGASGAPIRDAEVRLPYLDVPREYKTGPDGACRIDLPEPLPEQLGVFVEKSGFVPMRVVWTLSQLPAPLLPSEYTLPLEPGTAIGGRVLDERGMPIEGATVFLIVWPADGRGGLTVNAHVWERPAVTDANGRWRFDEAPADLRDLRYRLKHPGFVEEFRFTPASAEAEQLPNGTAAWVMKEGVRVEGVVTDPQGRPVANAELLTGRDRFCSGTKPSFHTDESGRFSFVLAPEPNTSLTVKAEGLAPALLKFAVTPGMAPMRIRLEPGCKIRLRTVDAAGAPVGCALVIADTWRRHRSLEWHGQTDEEGRLTWESAPPDEVGPRDRGCLAGCAASGFLHGSLGISCRGRGAADCVETRRRGENLRLLRREWSHPGSRLCPDALARARDGGGP